MGWWGVRRKGLPTGGLSYKTWRRPIFPESCLSSIVGPGGLNYRVRYGNGWTPSGMVTRKPYLSFQSSAVSYQLALVRTLKAA